MSLDGKRWSYTRNFSKKKGQAKFLERLDKARDLFPELDDIIIKVGITINMDGKADPEGKGVFFKSRNVSYYVMGHELTHLLQEVQGLPRTERSCDIFTMARSELFCDEAPYYVKIPKEMMDDDRFILDCYKELIHKNAKSAMALWRTGKRSYISWFEKTLKDSFEFENENQYQDYETPEWVLLNEPIQTILDEYF